MKIRSGSLFLICILVCMAFTILLSISFREMDALLAPLLLSIVIFVLAAVQLGKELRSDHGMTGEKTGDRAGETGDKTSEAGRFGAAFGWIFGFAAAISLAGFYVTIPLFSLVYMKHRGRRVWVSIVFAAAVTISIYLIFEIGLKSRLYRGLILNSL